MRHEEGAILNIEDLRQWFFLNQKQGDPNPYFSVYRGTEQKPDRIVFRNEAVSDTQEAWSMLHDVLEMHTQHGGLFRIFITDRAKGNVGLSTIYRIPGMQQMLPNGMMNAAGLYGMYQNPRDQIESEVAKEVAKERKIWELQQQITDLKKQQESSIGQMDSIIQEFLPVATELVRVFGLKMLGVQPTAPAQQNIGSHHGDDEEQQEQEHEFDYDRIDPALDKMKRVFPDTEDAMERLANWAVANPDMAKSMLNTI